MQSLAEEFAHTENLSAFIHTISPLSSAANPSLQEISRTITYFPPPKQRARSENGNRNADVYAHLTVNLSMLE